MADTSNVMLGSGVIRVANSITYISNTNPALNSVDKIGTNVECSISFGYDYQNRRPVGCFYPKKIMLTGASAQLNFKVPEVTQQNLNRAFGGDGSSGEFYIGPMKNHFRSEITFTYPDQIHQAIYILPKCRVVNPDSINLRSSSEPWFLGVNAEVSAPNDSTWGINLGKVHFNTL